MGLSNQPAMLASRCLFLPSSHGIRPLLVLSSPLASWKIPCQFYHSQGWCAKGEACIFLHDTHVVRVREALTWLPTLLLTGRVAVLAALRYTEGKGVGDTTSQPTSTAEPAPDLEDADNFPQLVDNGLSLVPLERAEEPLWTGARQIAFRQILNAFCNTLPQQSEVALEDVFVLQNFSLTSTMTQLLHMGKWMLRHWGGMATADFCSRRAVRKDASPLRCFRTQACAPTRTGCGRSTHGVCSSSAGRQAEVSGLVSRRRRRRSPGCRRAALSAQNIAVFEGRP